MSLGSPLKRLPLRVRLVAGFSVAMLVVLIAAGAFVYWRVEYALDRGLDTELTQATTTLSRLVRADGTVRNRDAAEATGVAWQVLDPSATVRAHGGPAGTAAMVSSHRLARVGRGGLTVNVGGFLPASPEPYRVRITKVLSGRDGSPVYLLVGVRRDHRDEALRELLLQLTLAGLGALAVTAFVGERLANAALRPVERYRRRAAAIAEGATGLRLEVPPDRDDEVTRLGHTLNGMLAALEQALDRERQFVNEASHELRTPITLLTSRLQLARRRPRSLEEHERILAELEVDLARLAHLAEQLLQVGAAARLASGSADLAALSLRLVERRRVADPTVAGELSAELPPGPLEVALGELALERILTNLLDNAVVHGAPPIVLQVDAPTPSIARVLVSDAGAGMSADLLATATRRFARSDEARTRAGAGLGLALVHDLVLGGGGELRLCHDGRHTSYGTPAPVPCDHGPEMTVSVLLPRPAP